MKDNDNCFHYYIIINDSDKDIIKLIDSCNDGYIRIWNYRSGSLINKIKIDHKSLYGICLWDNDHVFVTCEKRLLLVNISNNSFLNIKTLLYHKNEVVTIKKIKHSKYEECLISQGYLKDSIILWWFNK